MNTNLTYTLRQDLNKNNFNDYLKPDALLFDDMKKNKKKLLIYIAKLCHYTGRVRISQQTMANHLGVSIRTVNTYIGELRREKWIFTHYHGHKQTLTYSITSLFLDQNFRAKYASSIPCLNLSVWVFCVPYKKEYSININTQKKRKVYYDFRYENEMTWQIWDMLFPQPTSGAP